MKRIYCFLFVSFLLLSVGFAFDVGDTFQFGRDTDGSSLTWIVLEISENKAFVISENTFKEVRYYDTTDFRNVIWENSSLRRYLNEDFYEVHFTKEEKGRILETTVNNNEKSWYWRICKDTVDHLFLLSRWEVCKYFPTEQERLCEKKQDDYSWVSDWWLRTPGFRWGYASFVDHHGKVHEYKASDDEKGVRPAMWVSLSNL